MKERPIVMTAPMVRALLDGRKTQTRRAYKSRKHPDIGCHMSASELVHEPQHVIDRICPYGQPGDRLWARETWQTHCDKDGITPKDLPHDSHIQYPATYDGWVSKRRPSIHMPRWASRILLEITGVRVERLQDISYEDALAEGMFDASSSIEHYHYNNETTEETSRRLRWPQRMYENLWLSLYGTGSWDANPWVWVIEFKRVQP